MSRGHKIIQRFLQQRGAWDNKPSTSSVTKSTTPVTGHAFNEADVKVVQPAYNPRPGETIIGSTNGVENMNSQTQYVANGAVMQKKPQTNQVKTVSKYRGKNVDTPNTELKAQQLPVKTVTSYKGKNVGEAVVNNKPNKDASTEINRLGHQAGTGIKAGANIIDKSGAIHSPMSRARHLARQGLAQMLKLNPKIGESWSNTILDQLDEVHPAVMAMAKVAGKQSLKAKADQHTELALAANKAGDDAKVKFHQAQVAKIKAQMQKEAVTYTGLGTDVVDKKKKLNPQPNLTTDKKTVKDFKEENLDELKLTTMQSYADKAHQQAMDATYDAAHLNRSGEEKLKADAKRMASKRAGGVQLAQTKMDRMKENLESVNDVNEARVVEQPRAWNVRTLKPAGHGIVGKKVRSYDFPGIHDSHYVEGHVTDEDPQSYHIRTTKVVRHHKEEPIPAHLTHIRAPKGLHIFGNAPGVYYAPREQKPVAKPSMRTLRSKK